jgi:hypothetical protein
MVIHVADSTVIAHKRFACPLEERAYELLAEVQAEKGGKFIKYNEAASALVRLRVDKKTTMKLLALFSRQGIIKQSCGNGVKLAIEEARRR